MCKKILVKRKTKRSKRGKGQRCVYCDRPLQATTSKSRTAATKDHLIPKWLGGEYTSWACFQCNQLKGGMTLEAWNAFMLKYPQWWRYPEFGGRDYKAPKINRHEEIRFSCDEVLPQE